MEKNFAYSRYSVNTELVAHDMAGFKNLHLTLNQ